MKEKQDTVALLVAIAAAGIAAYPWWHPLGRITSGSVGLLLCGHQVIERRSERLRKASLKGEVLEEIESKSAQVSDELEALRLAEKELAHKKREWELERQSLERQLEREERDRAHEAKRLARIEEDALLERLEALETTRRQEIEAGLASAKKAIAELEAQREAIEQEWEIEAQKIRASAIAEGEAEVAERLAEIEQLEFDIAELVKAEREKLQSNLEAHWKGKFEEWIFPHCQEMDAKIKQIEALRATIQDLQDEINSNRDIKLSPDKGRPHGDRANSILQFLKQNGVYCDFQSSVILPDRTFVLNFRPWVVGPKTEKQIKGLLNALMVEFGLSEPPLFTPNGEAYCWTLQTFPVSAPRLDQFYVSAIPETRVGETFRDIEPELRQRVAEKLNYEEQVQEMMNFKPPLPLPRPRSRQISELELVTAKWLYSWRALATDGEKENVTTRAGLLRHLYGIKEGRATSQYDPILGEKLGDRVNRMLDMLKVEVVKLEQMEREADV